MDSRIRKTAIYPDADEILIGGFPEFQTRDNSYPTYLLDSIYEIYEISLSGTSCQEYVSKTSQTTST